MVSYIASGMCLAFGRSTARSNARDLPAPATDVAPKFYPAGTGVWRVPLARRERERDFLDRAEAPEAFRYTEYLELARARTHTGHHDLLTPAGHAARLQDADAKADEAVRQKYTTAMLITPMASSECSV